MEQKPEFHDTNYMHLVSALRIDKKQNDWNPPPVDEYGLAKQAYKEINQRMIDRYYYVFQITPYIDSLYIEYGDQGTILSIRRFTFHDDYYWDSYSENIFSEYFVKTGNCPHSDKQLDIIFKQYSILHPDWHLKRYYKNGIKMLDHIYHCIRRNTVKEMLYKAGLDELAVNSDDAEELNLLGTNPSALFDGLSMRALRSLNSQEGLKLISSIERRNYMRGLTTRYSTIVNQKLNRAQCRYLNFLIEGGVTMQEIARLFLTKRAELEDIWSLSRLDLFLQVERNGVKYADRLKQYSELDPLIKDYISKVKDYREDFNLKILDSVMLAGQEKYDGEIKRSNRKRNYSLQERYGEYCIRFPQTVRDFFREALYMRNCLMSYLEDYVRNTTTILFMRKTENVNTPYITVEIFRNKLEQAYHPLNKPCSECEELWIWDYCKRHGIKTRTKSFVRGFTRGKWDV